MAAIDFSFTEQLGMALLHFQDLFAEAVLEVMLVMSSLSTSVCII